MGIIIIIIIMPILGTGRGQEEMAAGAYGTQPSAW